MNREFNNKDFMYALQAKPVAWIVYVAEHQNQFFVDNLDDAWDELTNHGAVATPLYATPQLQPAIPAAPEQVSPKGA